MNELNKLYDERASLITQAGVIVNASESKTLSPEEDEKFNKLHDAAAAIMVKIEAIKKADARADRQSAAQADLDRPRGRMAPAAAVGTVAPPQASFNYGGRDVRLPPNSSIGRRTGNAAYAEAFTDYLSTGIPNAVLQTDIAESGGYFAPAQFVAELVKEQNNTFWMRQICKVHTPTTAPSVNRPKRKTRASPFQWGTELSAPAMNSGPTYGMYTLAPHYMTGEFELSKDLLAASALDIEAIIREEIVFASNEIDEISFLFGDGQKKPLGVMVPSADGVPAARDVVGVETTYDSWVDVKYSLREVYLRSPNLRWLINRTMLKTMSKIKTTTGEPLWLPSIRDGEPDRFLGTAVIFSEYMPAGTGAAGAFASGDYTGIIGDFRFYDIQDGLDFGIQRHTDSYYDRYNKVGYIVRRKVDGCPRFGDAFARQKKA